MRRRDFVAGISAAATFPARLAHAQQPLLPVVAFVNGASPETENRFAIAFHKDWQP